VRDHVGEHHPGGIGRKFEAVLRAIALVVCVELQIIVKAEYEAIIGRALNREARCAELAVGGASEMAEGLAIMRVGKASLGSHVDPLVVPGSFGRSRSRVARQPSEWADASRTCGSNPR